MEWSKGYVADIGYTAAFYRETAPAHMAFAALILGKSPGRALRPKRYLELGFGQGFGLALLAAANPDVAFEGYDFNPEHVAHVRRLIAGAGLENLAVTETSFEDAAARAGAGDLDVIAIHGILSWVSKDTREAIIAIARQRLQPDGLMYLSYNCMPGWAPLAPIRAFMLEVKRRQSGRSDLQLNAALDMLQKLRAANPAYFQLNPTVAQHVDQMLKLDRTYLAHEYLDEDWALFQSAEVAAMMGEAKLAFLASASLLENLDQYAVPQTMQAMVADTRDPVLKETLRDFAGSRRFRRDLFARGVAQPTTAEHRALLSGLKFVLAVPRANVKLKFAGPLNELTARADLHGPLLDRLAEGSAGFDDLMAVFPPGEGRVGLLLDCLALQVNSGQVLPIVGGEAPDKAPAQRFNRAVVDALRAGRIYNALAAPTVRTGLPATEFDLLALSAHFAGADSGATAARHALALVKGLNRSVLRDGKPIPDDAAALAFLEERLGPILNERLPVWRGLGIL